MFQLEKWINNIENRSLAEAWAAFRELGLPKQMDVEQLARTKVAFYTGAAMLMSVLQRIGDDDISEERGVDIIESYRQEVMAFVNGQAKRRES